MCLIKLMTIFRLTPVSGVIDHVVLKGLMDCATKIIKLLEGFGPKPELVFITHISDVMRSSSGNVLIPWFQCVGRPSFQKN